LANSPQARKRARQNEARRLHNAPQRSTVRTSIREVLKQVRENNSEGARAAYQRATSLIDKAVHQGHHHRNRAARLKSRLNRRVRSISAG
jgi:small subunit ribosomal protein S20